MSENEDEGSALVYIAGLVLGAILTSMLFGVC